MGLTTQAPRPMASTLEHPRWNEVLRALREARGVTQDGWAAQIGVSRKTVQRWEAGERAPDPGAETSILTYCRERNLFRPFTRGPLAGVELSPDVLHDLLAEARFGASRQAVTAAEAGAAARDRASEEQPGSSSSLGFAPSPAPPSEQGSRRPQPVAPPVGISNLPAALTSFVGREQELAAVRRTLARTRLLTLIGAGGCGKTRLALQVAGELLWAYPHGVWLVELAALADPALLPQAIASALEIRASVAQPLTEALRDALRARQLLLVLDNCEHLLPACAELTETLLRTCPHLEILATSREPLGIAGETLFWAPPMSVPSSEFRVPGGAAHPELGTRNSELEQADAVRLFVERARLQRPEFVLTADNAAAVTEICRRLDGMPLAIELAAARVNVLSVGQIAARLQDRFQLLTGGGRTALPRHQTLRATMEWSYELLTEPERALLRALSVFAGGFTLEAAEAVCSDLLPDPLVRTFPGCPTAGSAQGQELEESASLGSPSLEGGGRGVGLNVLDLLARLVDKSLVIAEERGDGVRYRMLETVRQYAAEKLAATGDADATRDQHALWCLALAETAWTHRIGPKQQTWLERLAVEHDNIRAALDWYLAQERGGSLGLQLGGLLAWWWRVRGHLDEGRRWLAALLARGGQAPPVARARAMEGAAWLALDVGAYDEAARLDEECLALRRELGDKAGIAGALNNLGVVFAVRGDHARAQELYEESLILARELGDPLRIASSLNNLGIGARQQGDPDRAVTLYEETLALAREMGNVHLIANALLNLGHAHLDQGALDGAMARYRESLTICRDLQDRQSAARCLQGMASVAVARDDAARAARLCGAAAALREAIGVQVPASGRAKFEQVTAVARAALGEAAFSAAWAAGQALSLEEAITEALSEST